MKGLCVMWATTRLRLRACNSRCFTCLLCMVGINKLDANLHWVRADDRSNDEISIPHRTKVFKLCLELGNLGSLAPKKRLQRLLVRAIQDGGYCYAVCQDSILELNSPG